jgi:undecaprenyl diphosphate synthase
MLSDSATVNNRSLQHLAIIMDGNGRWAKSRGLNRVAGHQQGGEAVSSIIEACIEHGIAYLSLFAFSSENWKRPQDEVDALMELLQHFLQMQRDKMLETGVQLRVIGDVARLTPALREALDEACEATADADRLILTLALSYGGRDEIVRAARRMAVRIEGGTLAAAAIDEALFSSCLDSDPVPDPDLLIRTGGEKRISNFMLWQLAYTELYFTDVQWPDFDALELGKAVTAFHCRRRRYGLIDEQLDQVEKEKDN